MTIWDQKAGEMAVTRRGDYLGHPDVWRGGAFVETAESAWNRELARLITVNPIDDETEGRLVLIEGHEIRVPPRSGMYDPRLAPGVYNTALEVLVDDEMWSVIGWGLFRQFGSTVLWQAVVAYGDVESPVVPLYRFRSRNALGWYLDELLWAPE